MRALVSLVVLGACAFAAVSLATFEKNDLPAYHLPPSSATQNRAGLVGAHLADFLLRALGYGVALLLVLVAGWCVLNFLGRGSEKIVTRAVGAVLLVGCTCTFASANGGGGSAALPGHGGTVGLALGDLVARYFGTAGQWMLGVPLVLFAMLLLSADALLAPPVFGAARASRGGLGRLFAGLGRWREQARERAQARKAAAGDEAPSIRDADTTAIAVALDAGDDVGRPVTVGYLDRVVQEGHAADGLGEEMEGDAAESLLQSAAASKRGRGQPHSYVLPPARLLDDAEPIDHSLRSEHIQYHIEVLERTLKEFGIGAKVVDIDQGPVVTRYELTLDAGTKLSRVTALSDDLAIATKAPAVRIVAPIPGKSTIGVELPNTDTELVRLRELIDSPAARKRQRILPLYLGKDASGNSIIGDLTQMPHLLIAGATGSGKSVCINSIISSILLTKHPDDVRLVLIDPKVVELAAFADLPHLLTPVVTKMKRAAWILDWACKTMDERYEVLARVAVRSIAAYNSLGEEEIRRRLGDDVDYEDVPFHLPYIVIIVDELADLMMLASKNIETSITRLAQKSRAVGLHIILATQRPSVDVITGLIKSNLPTRISFKVTSKVDSRTILDRNGADKLLGAGDMLFLPPGTASLVRAQGTYVSDDEIARLVGFIKDQRRPDFSPDLEHAIGDQDGEGGEDADGYTGDELYEDACRVVLASQRGSVSLLQRKLEIGYTRAARLIDMMAADGIVGDYKGSKAREVVMGLDQWEARRRGGGAPDGEQAPAPAPPPLDPDLAEESRHLEDDDEGD